MRKLIAGMKISLDGKSEGPEGYADWVEAWSEEYGLTEQIDACLLGSGMYTGYEQYWTAMAQNRADEPLPVMDRPPTAGELAWVRFAAQIPHYILSNTLTEAGWPAQTHLLRGLDEIAALKEQPGKDIYLVGGARITASLIDAGLVDELRLLVYPLLAGEGRALFATSEKRHGLTLQAVQHLSDGRLSLTYALAQG